MAKKKYTADDLMEWIYSECGIDCNGCSEAMNEFNTDESYFAERLFKLGWRQIEEKVYCPKCAKKKLK